MNKKLTIISALFLFNFTLFAQEELCPPVGLSVFGGDQENIIAWGEPIGNIGCGDFPVDDLPFVHEGNTTGAGSEWPTTYGSEDIAYTLNVTQTSTFDITLCSPVTTYDSYLEIFTNSEDCLNPVATGTYNDDDYDNCPDHNAPYPPSGIWGETLQPGQYYIVVSGFSTATGPYEISISLSGGRTINADYSIKTNWDHQQQKMAETGFSQDEIDAVIESLKSVREKEIELESKVKAGLCYAPWVDDYLQSDQTRYLD